MFLYIPQSIFLDDYLQGNRPTAITIICILNVIGVLASFLLVVALPTIFSIILGGASGAGGISGTSTQISTNLSGVVSAVYTAVLAFVIIFGIITLAITYGLWTGRSWAWWIYTIFLGISIVFSILSILLGNVGSLIGLIIDLIFIYFITRKNVKAFFNIKR